MSLAEEPEPLSSGRNPETRQLTVLWVATLLASAGVLAMWIGRSRPANLRYVWLTALALATVPGKLTIFTGLAPNSPLGPWGVATLGIAVDVILSATLALGLVPFRRLPGIGYWLDNAHRQAALALTQYPRLKRMAFWGVALFVALPLPGSGWMGGTFASQLVGLSRVMGVAAIAVGAAITGVVFALLAEALGEEAETLLKSPWIAGAGFVVLGVVAWLLWRRFRGLLRAR